MSPFPDPRLQQLDGFRVEIDPAHERADIVLDRPPLNVIEMGQRDQLRLVFESLDDNSRIRIIVLRAIGEHFSSGGNIKGFLDARPEERADRRSKEIEQPREVTSRQIAERDTRDRNRTDSPLVQAPVVVS